jgi:molybdate transport system regulatory protein
MQRVRFRIDLGPNCSIGPGKIELLETIGQTGSIRKAAAQLGMSYRYAWLLVDNINRSFNEPATTASVGGSGGGGVELTTFGADLVRRYRQAGRKFESIAGSTFEDLVPKSTDSATASRRPLRKRASKSAH